MVRARQPAQGKTVQMGCIPFEQSFLLTSAQRATDKHIFHLLHGDVHFHVRPDTIGKKSLISMCVCVIMQRLLRLLQNVYNACAGAFSFMTELLLHCFNA